jgi:hypothetical protein
MTVVIIHSFFNVNQNLSADVLSNWQVVRSSQFYRDERAGAPGHDYGNWKTAFLRGCLQNIFLLRRTMIEEVFLPIIVRASPFRAAFQPKAAGRIQKGA